MLAPRHDALILNATPEDKKRFWQKVTKSNDCWLYSPAHRSGYGAFWIAGVTINAHRVAKLWASKKPHLLLLACHICRNRNCVRPSHIYWGSIADNARDRIRDGTSKPDTHNGEYHPGSKLKAKDIKRIWSLLQAGGVSCATIAKKYGVTAGAISRISRRETWGHLTVGWPQIKTTRTEKGFRKGEMHHSSRLTREKVMKIRTMLSKGEKAVDIASLMGVNKATIADIRHGRTWRHVT